MLLLVLILVLIAFGLLVVALLQGSVLWAWVSVAVSAAAAAVLLVDHLQRRAAIRAGTDGAVGRAERSPARPSAAPAYAEPVTEVLPIIPASGSSPAADSAEVPDEPSGTAFDDAADGQRTVSMPIVQPSGSSDRPSGATARSTPSSSTASPTVTGSGVDPAGPRSSSFDEEGGRTAVFGDRSRSGGPVSAGPPPRLGGPDAPPHDGVGSRDHDPSGPPAGPADALEVDGGDLDDVRGPWPAGGEPDPGAAPVLAPTGSASATSSTPSGVAGSPPPETPPTASGPPDAPSAPDRVADRPPSSEPAATVVAQAHRPAGTDGRGAGDAGVAAAGPDGAPAGTSAGSAVPAGATAGGAASSTGDAGDRGPASGHTPGSDPDPHLAGPHDADPHLADHEDADADDVPDADADGDPPEEPLDVTAAAAVARLDDEVRVIDEQPRYHLTGCRALAGNPQIPLPAREAVELGFTPCGWCTPDRTLAARHSAAAR